MTPEQEIQALRAELAAERSNVARLTAAVEDMASREKERDALRVEQERETERQRVLRRERNARHRAARRGGDAGETLVRRQGDVSETSHPSFSSPPLDGSPLSSQTQHSPLLYPLPSSSTPSSGLADARPPVSHTSPPKMVGLKAFLDAEGVPEADPDDVEDIETLQALAEAPGVSGAIAGKVLAERLGPNPSAVPAGSGNHPAKPESSPTRMRQDAWTVLQAQVEAHPRRAPAAKAARKTSSKPDEKPPDQRHAPLVKALCDAFQEHTGAAYAFSPRSAKTVTLLLAQADCAPDTRGTAAGAAILQRWLWGLSWVVPLSNRRPVQTLEQLLMNWNDLAREPPRPEAPRANPNAPTQATEWDWTGASTGKERVDA